MENPWWTAMAALRDASIILALWVWITKVKKEE
jgi:hypothetical protein